MGKLKSLPNLVYTDGNGFSLWRNGELVAKIVPLEGDIETSGAKLKAPETLRALVADFLSWAPLPPTSAKALAQTSARLCRLLRDEVLEEMAAGPRQPAASEGRLAEAAVSRGEGRAIRRRLCAGRHLRPPDGARLRHLAEGRLDLAAIKLSKTNSLIGTALTF